VQALGLGVFGDLGHKMHNVVAVEIPSDVVGDQVRAAMLDDHGIEIGTSFGPLHGRVWRIGTMGYNARKDTVVTTLAALEHALRRAGHAVPSGGGVDAALDVYGAVGAVGAVAAGVSA
jgi:(S)-ureidoglycine-glyoxylate aminotransferase